MELGIQLLKWALILGVMAKWMHQYGGGERATLSNVMCLVWSIASGLCLLFGIFEFIGE